ncbi:MAG TPA: Kazal domain-containing protein [Thermoanaerobaculia bacterium]|jgi:hypothetical protein|nr:Kazal domain-containing protein [Thermoanaerobaculia bacterium]
MRGRHASRAVLMISLFLLCSVGSMASLPTAAPFFAAAEPAGQGGTCTTNQQCAKDEFCAKLYGSCGETGKCEARPQDCTEHGKLLVKPVCGCDDKTYDNFCLAAIAGVNVKQEGKCAP